MLSGSSCDSKRLGLSVHIERNVDALPPIEFGDLRRLETRSFKDVGGVEGKDDVGRGRKSGDLAQGWEVEAV